MTFDDLFRLDALAWIVAPIAVLEGLRVGRAEVLLHKRTIRQAVVIGAVEALLLCLIAIARSPIAFATVVVVRLALTSWRERGLFGREALKVALVSGAMGVVAWLGVRGFEQLPAIAGDLGSTWRTVVLALVSTACVLGIVPVRIEDEPRTTLAAPMVLMAFARVGVPLAAAEPELALVLPAVGVVVGLLCALWLLSAGMRANHFEHASLVSELVVCERGILLSFVWLGLASGERLAGVGAFCEWWTAALALMALDATLRVRTLPKPMVFFVLAMAVGIPGTMGFVAEDLLAHGLLGSGPILAAGFVAVSAIHAAGLYLALVNLIVDGGHGRRGDTRPTALMLVPAALSLVIGVAPGLFVRAATDAHAAVAPASHFHAHVASRD